MFTQNTPIGFSVQNFEENEENFNFFGKTIGPAVYILLEFVRVLYLE